ncbi:hypothetical protein EV714DRAFT_222467, partial [Schizophyllum commune]
WLVGMAALLRFVRASPERDGAAVVVCSSPSSIGTSFASHFCTFVDNDLLAACYRSLKTGLLCSTSLSTAAPA